MGTSEFAASPTVVGSQTHINTPMHGLLIAVGNVAEIVQEDLRTHGGSQAAADGAHVSRVVAQISQVPISHARSKR